MTSEAGVWGEVSSDAALLAAVRAGDNAAFAELFERHAPAARALARQYASHADAEDIVSDAFAKVLSVLQGGGGPEETFRAYLFTVVRRLAWAGAQAQQRVQPTDDVATFESAYGPAGSVEQPALEGFERSVVARAYNALPERWQAVLWYTEIEGLSAAEIAPLLGLSANGVAALAYRAREGLREAYLQSHLSAPPSEACQGAAEKLGSYVRGGLSRRDVTKVEAHLEGCTECRALVAELGDVNHGLRAIVAPLVLGIAGVGALKAGGLGLGGQVAALGAAGAATAGSAGAGTSGSGGGAGSGGGLGGAITSAPTGVLVGAAAVVVAVVGVGVAAGLGVFDRPPSSSLSAGQGGPVVSSTPEPSATATGEPGAEPSEQPAEIEVDFPDPLAEDDEPGDGPTSDPTPEPTRDPDGSDDEPGDEDEPGDDEPGDEDEPGDDEEPGGEDEPGDDDGTGDEDEPGDDDEQPAAPELRFARTDGVTLAAGTAGTLDLSVTNTGGTPVRNLAAAVELPELPEGVRLVSVRSATLGGDPGEVTLFAEGIQAACGSPCALGTLAPGQTVEITVDVEVDELAPANPAAQVRVTFTGTGLPTTTLGYPVAVEAAPARLVTTVPGSTIQVDRAGDGALIPVRVENRGGSPAQDVRVGLYLPDDVSWAPALGSVPGDLECVEGTGDPGSPDVTCLLGDLAARTPSETDFVEIAVPVSAEGSFTAGEVTVETTAQPPAVGDTASVDLTGVGQPAPASFEPVGDLTVNLEVHPESILDLVRGRFTLTLTTNATSTTSGVLYVDLPSGLVFVGYPGPAGDPTACVETAPGSADGACAVTLEPGEVTTVTYYVDGSLADLLDLENLDLSGSLVLEADGREEPVVVQGFALGGLSVTI